MDGEREQTGRPTPPFLYVLILMAGAGGAIAILGTFFEVLHRTDGDGGAPYVAVDSPAALHNAPSSQCSDAVQRAGGDCDHY